MSRTLRIARRIVSDYAKAVKLSDAIESSHLEGRMVWIGENEPEVRPLRPEIGPKPRGGLWYSSGSDWARFLIYDAPERTADQVYILKLNYTKMFVPQSLQQLNEFIQEYANPPDNRGRTNFGSVQINWEKVIQRFSGVDVTNDNVFDREHPMLYTWDIPSGVVWDPSALVGFKLVLQHVGTQYQNPQQYAQANT